MQGNQQPLGTIVLFLLVSTAFLSGCSGGLTKDVIPTPTLQARSTVPPNVLPSPTSEPIATPSSVAVLSRKTAMPLSLGNTWVYQATRYEAVPITEFITATSIITETIIDLKTEPSYLAAKIHRSVSAETPLFVAPSRRGEPLRPAESSEYWLVAADNRIYRQEAGPDLSKLSDKDSLEFIFPLNPGDKWVWLPARVPTNPETGGIFRQVLQVGAVQVPAERFDKCFFIKDDWATDTVENLFCPGVGWVDRRSDHNGTPFGSRQVLIRYQLKP